MRDYETIAIFKVECGEDYIADISKKIEKIAGKKPGKFGAKNDWGTKKFAYEIQKEKQGRYMTWTYSQEGTVPAEIDKAIRFEESILRYATYLIDPKEGAKEAKILAKKAAKGKTPKAPAEGDRKPRPKIDFRNPISLAKYLTEKGKIVPRRVSGNNAQTQRLVSREIKRARQIGLLSCMDGLSYGERTRDRDSRDGGREGGRDGGRDGGREGGRGEGRDNRERTE